MTLGCLFGRFFLAHAYIQGIQMKVLGKTLYSAILITAIGAAFASDKELIEKAAEDFFKKTQQSIMQSFPGDNRFGGDDNRNNISAEGISAAFRLLKFLDTKESEEFMSNASGPEDLERKFNEIMKGPAEAKSKKAG